MSQDKGGSSRAGARAASFALVGAMVCGLLVTPAQATADAPGRLRLLRSHEAAAGAMGATPDAGRFPGEAASAQVQRQLDAIAALLERDAPIRAGDLDGLVAPDAGCAPLRPAALRSVRTSGAALVRRGDLPAADPASCRGAGGLASSLEQLRGALAGQGAMEVTFDIVGISLGAGAIDTNVFYHAAARGKEAAREQTAAWKIIWRRAGDAPPVIASIDAAEYEEVEAPRRLFVDDTWSILGHEPVWSDQFRRGADDWLGRIESWIESDGFGHHGLAVGDVDGDGLEDLYVCDMGGLPNRLFRQNPDGTATDISARAGVDWLERTRSALLLDLDNDGDQDLVVATSVALLFMSNDGTGRFTLETNLGFGDDGALTAGSVRADPVRTGGMDAAGAAEGHFSRAGDLGTSRPSNLVMLAAADYDADGDLDIYACTYHARGESLHEFPIPIPYHDANNGGRNVLLENKGKWTFVDATDRVGLDENNRRFSFAAAWEDFDDDGDPDLYVANDFGRNNLYRNDGGRFRDIAAAAGVEDVAAGMSAAWGDYDNDGRMDLYVGNMFSPAGSRLSDQEDFHPGAPESVRSQYRSHARGNSLYRNAGNGTFEDVSRAAGVTLGRWAWDSRFLDVDNDGWEDLLSVNGYFTRDAVEDLHGYFWWSIVAQSPLDAASPEAIGGYAGAWRALGRMIRDGMSLSGREPDSFFLNTGTGRFAFAGATVGLDFRGDGRSVAVADWDLDGDLDLWMASRTAPRLLFARNRLDPGATGRWLAVRLEGATSNRDAVGARVTVTLPDGATRHRSLAAGSGYLSQSGRWIHIGLGEAESIRSLTVRWPASKRPGHVAQEDFGPLAPGRRWRIVQGEGRAHEWSPPPRATPPDPGPIPPPPDPDLGRTAFSSPGPAPIVSYVRFDGTHAVADGSGPLLVTLWSSDCAPCDAQLLALAAAREGIAKAGLRVLALNVDAMLDLPEADAHTTKKGMIEALGFPFEAGVAHPRLIEKIDLILDRLIAAPRPLPVPSSVLIDGNALVAAIYRGPFDPEALLEDLPALSLPGPRRLTLAIPFNGLRQTRGTPDVFETMDGVARAWADHGFAEDAIDYYEKVLRIQPRRAAARFELANALAAVGRSGEAVEHYRQVIEGDPVHAGAMNNLGFLLAGRGDLDEAIALYREAVKVDPGNVQALDNLASALMAQGDLDAAIATFRRAIALAPDNLSVINNLAVALARSGDDAGAIENYRRLLSLDPDSVAAHINLDIALMRRGDGGEALAHLAEAVRLRPDYAEARYHRGVALLRQGKRPEAASELTEAVDLSPTHRAARYHLSLALAMLGRLDEAVRAMAEAVGAENAPAAAARLSWALAAGSDPGLRDGDRALAIAERICAGIADTDCLDLLGVAYAASGRYEEAVRAARGAIERAQALGQPDRADAIRARLRDYEAGRAWHEPASPR